jgi:hypothetical protein
LIVAGIVVVGLTVNPEPTISGSGTTLDRDTTSAAASRSPK